MDMFLLFLFSSCSQSSIWLCDKLCITIITTHRKCKYQHLPNIAGEVGNTINLRPRLWIDFFSFTFTSCKIRLKPTTCRIILGSRDTLMIRYPHRNVRHKASVFRIFPLSDSHISRHNNQHNDIINMVYNNITRNRCQWCNQ